MIPNRLLRELGESASRYSLHATEHSSGCCVICRRFLRDLWQALTDESNWEPDSLNKQIERLQDELTRLKESQPIAKAAPPVEPMAAAAGDDIQGGFFPPPGRHEEE